MSKEPHLPLSETKVKAGAGVWLSTWPTHTRLWVQSPALWGGGWAQIFMQIEI